MGKRTRNKKNINNIVKDSNAKMATIEQMDTIQDFFKKYSTDLKKDIDRLDLLTKISSSNGQYNPILSEQYLNDIMFNPRSASSEDITKWLMNPQGNNKNIRALSQYLESAVGQYGRAIWELNVEKSFKYMLVPSDVNNSNYINSQEYTHSYELAADVCRKLNIKSQFPKIDLTVMEKGVGFYLIDEKSDNITLLELPSEYCYITAPWTYGWMFAVDLTFFDRMVTMPTILPELTGAYNEMVEKRRAGFRGDKLAPYQYYNVPVEKSFCFTFNPCRADKLPPLTGSMTAALDVISYRDLLRKKSLLDLWKLIALKIPVDKDSKRPILTFEEASQYIAMIQEQLPENIVSYVSPFDSTEVSSNQVSTLDSLVGLGNNNIYSSMGVSPNAFGLDNKNAGAIRLSLEINFHYASTHMYAQFANLVNWLIYLKTRRFKWKVNFFGMKLNHDKEIDSAVKVTTQTNFPIEYLMANVGMEPFQIQSFVNWSNKMDLKSKMTPIQSQFTQSSSGDEKSGRPKSADSELSDDGEKSREYKQ